MYRCSSGGGNGAGVVGVFGGFGASDGRGGRGAGVRRAAARQMYGQRVVVFIRAGARAGRLLERSAESNAGC